MPSVSCGVVMVGSAAPIWAKYVRVVFLMLTGGGDLDLSRMAQTQRRRRRGAQDTTRTPRRSGYSPTRGSVLPSLARSATVALRNLMAVGYPGPTCSGAYCAPRATTFPVMSPPGASCGWLFRHLRISLLRLCGRCRLIRWEEGGLCSEVVGARGN